MRRIHLTISPLRFVIIVGALLLILSGIGVKGFSALTPEELSALFDGRASSSGEWNFSQQALKKSPAPPLARDSSAVPAAEPVEPPPDLIEAGKTWGNKAQIAKLLSENPDPNAAFTISVIGDSEPGRWIWRWLFPPGKHAYRDQMRNLQKKNPDAIFHVGDFVSVGTVKNYRKYIKFLNEEIYRPLITLIGNHDRSIRSDLEADKTLYRAIFGDTNFSFDHNGWRFVLLDTANFRLTREQIAWLDKVLETPLKKLVFIHMPPAFLKKAIKTVRAKGYQARKLVAPAYFDKGSNEFGEIVAKHGVLRVYMGHIHAFGTADYKGVRYILTGGGGSPLYPRFYAKHKFAHYILVNLAPDGILQETVCRLDGESFNIPQPTP